MHRLLACRLKVISMRHNKEIFCRNFNSCAAKSATLLHCGFNLSNATMSPALKACNKSTSQLFGVPFKDSKTGCANNSPRLYTPSPKSAASPRKKACCSCSCLFRLLSSMQPRYLNNEKDIK